MSIRRDQMPATPAAMWQAIRALQRQIAERASQLTSVLRRPDQSVAATLAPAWAWYDKAGNVVCSEDAVAGMGMGRPYVPIVSALARYTDWPGTTNASFEDVHRMTIKKMQAYAYLSIGHTTDVSGTAGELQVTVNGAVTGAVTTVAFSQAAVTIGPFALPGAYLDQVEIRVQAHRTAGTGAVRTAILAASQIQA